MTGKYNLKLVSGCKHYLFALEEINLHQSLKTDEQRLKKILSDQNESYFKFLKEKQGKTIVDNDIVNQATESVRVLKADPEICELLQLNPDSELEVYNELYIEAPVSPVYPFGIKGVIDKIYKSYIFY